MPKITVEDMTPAQLGYAVADSYDPPLPYTASDLEVRGWLTKTFDALNIFAKPHHGRFMAAQWTADGLTGYHPSDADDPLSACCKAALKALGRVDDEFEIPEGLGIFEIYAG